MESASKENRTKEALLGYQGSTKLWIGNKDNMLSETQSIKPVQELDNVS
jgi:hypothetical protein